LEFPPLQELAECSRPIRLESFQTMLRKFDGWSSDIDCSFFMHVQRENAINLLSLMSEDDFNNALAKVRGVDLSQLSAEEKRRVYFELCVVRFSSREKRWRSLREVRDYFTTDFSFTDQDWSGSLTHVACRENDGKLLQDLRDLGFPLDTKDKDGKTPFEYAFGLQVFALMLQFALEDAGLGKYFIPPVESTPKKRPPEIQARVEKVLLEVFTPSKHLEKDSLDFFMRNFSG
jgi:hypothetical protein